MFPDFFNSFSIFIVAKVFANRITSYNVCYTKLLRHTDDLKLKATLDKSAPITLVRLILAKSTMTEKQVVNEIFKLAIFSGSLAIVTALMMRVHL